MGRGVELEASGPCLLKNGNYGAGCVVWGECVCVWGGCSLVSGKASEGGGLEHGLCKRERLDTGAFVLKAPGTPGLGEEEETLCQFAPAAITNYCGILKQHRFMISP